MANDFGWIHTRSWNVLYRGLCAKLTVFHSYLASSGRTGTPHTRFEYAVPVPVVFRRAPRTSSAILHVASCCVVFRLFAR